MSTGYWIYFTQATAISNQDTDRSLLDRGYVKVSLVKWVLACLLLTVKDYKSDKVPNNRDNEHNGTI
jgi:hypothetical protein